MSILTDTLIKREVEKHNMISPFVADQASEGIISYGLSSYGYDARLAPEFKIFTDTNTSVVDPKNFSHSHYTNKENDVCIMPPHSFVLGRTVEYFKIPSNCFAICIGKSTYARCGVFVNVTPLEPGSEGHVVLEFANPTPLPVKLYANEGICQFVFFMSEHPCETSYKDRHGKYFKQTGITLPKIK